ncbi:MAG: hypothetical protein H0W13_11500 [Nitrospirales bacterium]|nr:hypothetical protein [Nitrospirales bacterium]
MVAYIQRDSAVYAAEMAGRIVTAIEKLAGLPKLGNRRQLSRRLSTGGKTPWDCRGRPRQPRPLTPPPSRFLGSEY